MREENVIKKAMEACFCEDSNISMANLSVALRLLPENIEGLVLPEHLKWKLKEAVEENLPYIPRSEWDKISRLLKGQFSPFPSLEKALEEWEASEEDPVQFMRSKGIRVEEWDQILIRKEDPVKVYKNRIGRLLTLLKGETPKLRTSYGIYREVTEENV